MPRHIGLSVTALLLAACTTGGVSQVTIRPRALSGPVPGAGVCAPDQPCELIGKITLEHRSGNNSWAALTQKQEGECAPLLLPESVYDRWRRWDGKRVRVSGVALKRGPAAEDVLQLQYRDRWLSPAICSDSELALYVQKITLMH